MKTILAAVAFCLIPVFSLAQTIERPGLRPGDTWVYEVRDLYSGEIRRHTTFKVVEVNDSNLIVERVRGDNPVERRTYTREWNLLDDGERKYQPFYPSFRFPLQPGAKWEGSAEAPRRDGDGFTRFTFTVTVPGWEEIDTPAGKFKALKVVREGFQQNYRQNRSTPGQPVTETTWYVPELRRFAKHSYVNNSRGGDRFEQVLTRFSLSQ